jgi:hypothetical protein
VNKGSILCLVEYFSIIGNDLQYAVTKGSELLEGTLDDVLEMGVEGVDALPPLLCTPVHPNNATVARIAAPIFILLKTLRTFDGFLFEICSLFIGINLWGKAYKSVLSAESIKKLIIWDE